MDSLLHAWFIEQSRTLFTSTIAPRFWASLQEVGEPGSPGSPPPPARPTARTHAPQPVTSSAPTCPPAHSTPRPRLHTRTHTSTHLHHTFCTLPAAAARRWCARDTCAFVPRAQPCATLLPCLRASADALVGTRHGVLLAVRTASHLGAHTFLSQSHVTTMQHSLERQGHARAFPEGAERAARRIPDRGTVHQPVPS
jgi:hypothetical protein